jgi:hypothetical protein
VVDGHIRATAHHDNSYDIHGSEFGRRALPDSRLHLDRIERQLGLDRVEEFREADGHAIAPSPRAKLEREAKDVRQNLGKQKEPIAYLRAALHTLEHETKRRGKSTPEARDAAAMLADALAKIDERNDRWTRPVFDQVFHATDLLRRGIDEERLPADGTEARAEQLCGKALACIGFEDIEKEEPPADSTRKAAIEKAARQESERRDRDSDLDRD